MLRILISQNINLLCVSFRLLLCFLAAALVYVYFYVCISILYAILWWQWGSTSLQAATHHRTGPVSSPIVPKRLHQTWKDREVPQRWRQAQATCQMIHRDYEYKLWTDEEAEHVRAFMPVCACVFARVEVRVCACVRACVCLCV